MHQLRPLVPSTRGKKIDGGIGSWVSPTSLDRPCSGTQTQGNVPRQGIREFWGHQERHKFDEEGEGRRDKNRGRGLAAFVNVHGEEKR